MAYITSATEIARPQPAPVAETRTADSARSEYTIKSLTSRVIRLTISGFWTQPVVDDFRHDIAATVKALPCAPEEHLVLCDMSGAAIQSRTTFEAFLAMLTDPRWSARRVAFVSANPISRMQARRMMAAREGVALFEDETTAIRWLTADA